MEPWQPKTLFSAEKFGEFPPRLSKMGWCIFGMEVSPRSGNCQDLVGKKFILENCQEIPSALRGIWIRPMFRWPGKPLTGLPIQPCKKKHDNHIQDFHMEQVNNKGDDFKFQCGMFEGKESRNNMFLKRQQFLQSQCFQNACPRCRQTSLSQPPPLPNKKLSCGWDSHLYVIYTCVASRIKIEESTCPVKLMFPESFPANIPDTGEHSRGLKSWTSGWHGTTSPPTFSKSFQQSKCEFAWIPYINIYLVGGFNPSEKY